jgi:hypothetical protein
MTHPNDGLASDTPEHREHVHRASMAQGAAASIADLLMHLMKISPGEGDVGVSISEDHRIMLSFESALAIYDAAAQGLPRCYTSPRGLLEDGCTMPEAICHPCAAEGRRVTTARYDGPSR